MGLRPTRATGLPPIVSAVKTRTRTPPASGSGLMMAEFRTRHCATRTASSPTNGGETRPWWPTLRCPDATRTRSTRTRTSPARRSDSAAEAVSRSRNQALFYLAAVVVVLCALSVVMFRCARDCCSYLAPCAPKKKAGNQANGSFDSS